MYGLVLLIGAKYGWARQSRTREVSVISCLFFGGGKQVRGALITPRSFLLLQAGAAVPNLDRHIFQRMEAIRLANRTRCNCLSTGMRW